MTTHRLSQRRACGLIGITRRGLRRAPGEDRNRLLRQRLRELAEERRRWGCPMLYLMLRREGFKANHKRVERLYREEGLSRRRRRRRKRLSHLRVVRRATPGGKPNVGGRFHSRQPIQRAAVSRVCRAR